MITQGFLSELLDRTAAKLADNLTMQADSAMAGGAPPALDLASGGLPGPLGPTPPGPMPLPSPSPAPTLPGRPRPMPGPPSPTRPRK